jgi:hypothetical protein
MGFGNEPIEMRSSFDHESFAETEVPTEVHFQEFEEEEVLM